MSFIKRIHTHLSKMPYGIPFLGTVFPITVVRTSLELEAHPTPEEPVRWDEDKLTIVRRESDVALGENVTAIRKNFGMARYEFGQTLAQLNAEIGIQVIRGLAIRVLLRDDRTVDPPIAGSKLGAGTWNFCSDAGRRADAITRSQLIPQGGFDRTLIGSQGASVRINHGHIEIAGEALLVDEAHAERVHVAGVISKNIREIIRKIIRSGNGTVTKDCGVAGGIVKNRGGQAGRFGEVVLDRKFFVDAVFKDGMPIAAKQGGKLIQLIHGGLERARGAGGVLPSIGGEQRGGLPGRREAHGHFDTRADRRGEIGIESGRKNIAAVADGDAIT